MQHGFYQQGTLKNDSNEEELEAYVIPWYTGIPTTGFKVMMLVFEDKKCCFVIVVVVYCVFFYFFMGMWVLCVCKCTHLCTCANKMEKRRTLCVLFYPYLLFSWVKLSDWTWSMLGSQEPTAVSLSLPRYGWYYRREETHPDLYIGAGDLNSGLFSCLHSKHSYPLIHLYSPKLFLLCLLMSPLLYAVILLPYKLVIILWPRPLRNNLAIYNVWDQSILSTS